MAGEKLYLSPVLDLFNGEIVAHQIDTSPHYPLVGQMLEQALSQLPEGARPMLHSDQGWPTSVLPLPESTKKEMGLERACHAKATAWTMREWRVSSAHEDRDVHHGQRFASTLRI